MIGGSTPIIIMIETVGCDHNHQHRDAAKRPSARDSKPYNFRVMATPERNAEPAPVLARGNPRIRSARLLLSVHRSDRLASGLIAAELSVGDALLPA